MCSGLQSESGHLDRIRWGLETPCDGSEDKERMFTLESFRMWGLRHLYEVYEVLDGCAFDYLSLFLTPCEWRLAQSMNNVFI